MAPISRSYSYQTALDNINAAWKTATEAMYAQGEQGQAAAEPQAAEGDNVQDVDYESKIILLY
jgi:molecular chaperone DnaK